MSASLLWTALFVGNVALFFVWINYIVKVLRGQCPHCGN
jgi:hypothetical protein